MQTKQRLDVPLSLKSVSDSGEFEGYGSVFGVKDSHDDVVMSGAFAASLRAWSDRKALPALLWQHRMDEPIGVYTEMKEDDVGLYVRGRLLIDDDPLAKRAHAHMKAGSLTGLSIGYVLKDWEYDRSKEAFLLKEIDLWEVSLVTFPSNDEARITTIDQHPAHCCKHRNRAVDFGFRRGFIREDIVVFVRFYRNVRHHPVHDRMIAVMETPGIDQ